MSRDDSVGYAWFVLVLVHFFVMHAGSSGERLSVAVVRLGVIF